ncbi:hypothetical protein [Oceanobacillus indicireducens]|uniref:Uncharacterized protein n=1 Tax=Oceanobacillus indicireducens TaxID=1004261 RepID=A0A917Y3G0_9BACI|nr:hypothetical protein [Oceanobacillus indicireducens]GGN64595.1 hypothetical protein GCM10007971_32640 [Oceanobacillus indicireducens]
MEEGKQKSKKPVYKRWWFWLGAFILFGFIVGQTSDNEEQPDQAEAQEKQEEQENQKEQEKEEQKKVEEEEKEKKKEEEKKKENEEKERKANRTTAEALEEDSKNVDEASMDGGKLTLKHNPGTVWNESSFMATVYDMFEDAKTAFDDEEIDSVAIEIETTMTDEKGNESVDPVIKYNYSREAFEELNYENFTNMAYAEEWRILREADYYYIHPGIYKNLKDKYKDNLNVEGFRE